VKTIIYIDSFNLYYGRLKNTPFKWLNVSKLCSYLFPYDEIIKIKYFTAQVKNRLTDKDIDRPNRQQIYLRTLKTIPNLEIIEGTFLTHKVDMKLASGTGYVEVIKSEEKGTDVNIATYLVHDAHKNKFEKAVIISNDSDLVTPIKIVKEELCKHITVISPYERNSIQLKAVATDVRKIRNGVLRISQFDEKLSDSVGEFFIPEKWKLLQK
jgi:uncharacterized LabA/DUF88 family protein